MKIKANWLILFFTFVRADEYEGPYITDFINVGPIGLTPPNPSLEKSPIPLEWFDNVFDYGLINEFRKTASNICFPTSKIINNMTTTEPGREYNCYRTIKPVWTGNMYDTKHDMFCRYKGGKAKVWRDEGVNISCRQFSSTSFNTINYPKFMYDTGLGHLGIRFSENNGCQNEQVDIRKLIILKRDGPGNLYHFINEAFAYYVSLKVLEAENDSISTTNELEQFKDYQLVLMDSYGDGPFIKFWQKITSKPLLHQINLQNSTCVSEVLFVLSGGSSPLWKANWPKLALDKPSKLVEDFKDYMLKTMQIQQQPSTSQVKKITVIGRRGNREIVDIEKLMEEWRVKFLENGINNVFIREIFFETMTFEQQMQTAQESTILVGVHGAGLGNALWMNNNNGKKTAVVEICPFEFKKYGFRNMATLSGVGRYEFVTSLKIADIEYNDYHKHPVLINGSEVFGLLIDIVKNL